MCGLTANEEFIESNKKWPWEFVGGEKGIRYATQQEMLLLKKKIVEALKMEKYNKYFGNYIPEI